MIILHINSFMITNHYNWVIKKNMVITWTGGGQECSLISQSHWSVPSP